MAGHVDMTADTLENGGFAPVPQVRIPFVRRCVLWRGGRRSEGVICNLSALGVYVTFPRLLTDTLPDAGDTVQIAFLLPGDAMPVQSDAIVTWQNIEESEGADSLPPGCGLRFVSLRPDDHHRIGELVHDYCHAPQPRIAVSAPHTGFIRMPYVQPCVLVGGHGTWEGVLCNVSLVGAYVTVDPLPPSGERIRLLFSLRGKPVEAQCEVAWLNTQEPLLANSLPQGCGLRFVEPDDNLQERLGSLIADYESLPRSGI